MLVNRPSSAIYLGGRNDKGPRLTNAVLCKLSLRKQTYALQPIVYVCEWLASVELTTPVTMPLARSVVT
jgi:chaperone required for assembly of F1-ATPase